MERFEKIKELGRGATGTVFKAFDNEKGILVALKIPDPPPESIDVSTHYKREVKLIGALKHDNIVSIESYDIESSVPWIAYEFIKGHTLRELFTSQKEFTVEEASRITLELAHALRYLHTEGIVHRDVNPNNIMITSDGSVKLMDFGIAHRSGEPFPKQLAGTPGYMSPETAKGDEGGPESDLYSLGLVYYEMLCGSPAFTGESVPEVIGKVMAGDFKPLDQVKPDLDEKIHEIVSKMLAKQPQDRYMSMEQLITELDKLLSVGKEETTEKVETDEPLDSVDILEGPPKIVGIGGPYKGYEFEFGATITTIGRTYSDIDLSLDQEVSYQHCWIVPEDGVYWLYDAEDSGGTFLGGHPIKKARLIPGDRITIGSTTFKWENPADRSPAFRDEVEIEYAPMPQAYKSGATKQRIGSQVQDYRAGAPFVMLSTRVKVLGVFAILGLLAFFFYFMNDYYLVPRNESKMILLKLEDYWVEMAPVVTAHDANTILENLMAREDDYDYYDLEALELRTSWILKFPSPSKIREQNAKRVNIVIRTLDLLNYLRSDMPIDAKLEQITQTRNYLKAATLPEKDIWDSRRLRIDRSLFDIEIEFKQALVDDPIEPTQPAGPIRNAVEKFLDGYYIVHESRGNLSVNLANQVFDVFDEAANLANNILRRDSRESTAKVIVILSNYYMVDLRMEHLTSQQWTPDLISNSEALLKEGRQLLEEMSAQEYDAGVPEQVTDHSLRVQGRIRARYLTLIDRFQRMTGIDMDL